MEYGRIHSCCLKDKAQVGGPKFVSALAKLQFFCLQRFSLTYVSGKWQRKIHILTSRCHQITLEPSERRGFRIQSVCTLLLHFL